MRRGMLGFPPGHLKDLSDLDAPYGPRQRLFEAIDYPNTLYTMVVPSGVYAVYINASAGGAGGTATGPVNGQAGGDTQLSINGQLRVDLPPGQGGATRLGGVAALRAIEVAHSIARANPSLQNVSPPSGPTSATNAGNLWTGGAGQLSATPSPGGTGHFSGYGTGGVSANGTNGAGAGASCDQLHISVSPGDKLEILVGRRGNINSSAGNPGSGEHGFMLISW